MAAPCKRDLQEISSFRIFFCKFGATGWLQGMFVDLFSALASDDAKTAAGQFGRRPWGARSAAPG